PAFLAPLLLCINRDVSRRRLSGLGTRRLADHSLFGLRMLNDRARWARGSGRGAPPGLCCSLLRPKDPVALQPAKWQREERAIGIVPAVERFVPVANLHPLAE